MTKRVNAEGVRVGSNAGKLYWIDSLGFEYGLYNQKNYDIISIKDYIYKYMYRVLDDGIIFSHTVNFLENIYIYLITTNVDIFFKHPKFKKKNKRYIEYFKNRRNKELEKENRKLRKSKYLSLNKWKNLKLEEYNKSLKDSSNLNIMNLGLYAKYSKELRLPVKECISYYNSLVLKKKINRNKNLFTLNDFNNIKFNRKSIGKYRYVFSVFRLVYFNLVLKNLSKVRYKLNLAYVNIDSTNVRIYYIYINLLKSILYKKKKLYYFLELLYYSKSFKILQLIIENIKLYKFKWLNIVGFLKKPNYYIRNYNINSKVKKLDSILIVYLRKYLMSNSRIKCLESIVYIVSNYIIYKEKFYKYFVSLSVIKDWVLVKNYLYFLLISSLIKNDKFNMVRKVKDFRDFEEGVDGVRSAFGKRLMYNNMKLYCDTVLNRSQRITKYLVEKLSEEKMNENDSKLYERCGNEDLLYSPSLLLVNYYLYFIVSIKKKYFYKGISKVMDLNMKKKVKSKIKLKRYLLRVYLYYLIFRLCDLFFVSQKMVFVGKINELSNINDLKMVKYIKELRSNMVIEPLIYEIAPKLDEYVFLNKKVGISLKSNFGFLDGFIKSYVNNMLIKSKWLSYKEYKKINLNYNLIIERNVFKLETLRRERLNSFGVYNLKYKKNRSIFLDYVNRLKKTVRLSTINKNILSLKFNVLSGLGCLNILPLEVKMVDRSNIRLARIYGNQMYYKLLLYRLGILLKVWNHYSMYYYFELFENLYYIKSYLEDYIYLNFGKELVVNFRVLSRYNITANILAEYIIVRLRKKDRITHIMQMIRKQLRISEKRDFSSLERKTSFYRKYVMDSTLLDKGVYKDYKNNYVSKFLKKDNILKERIGTLSWNKISNYRNLGRQSIGSFGKRRYRLLNMKKYKVKNALELASRSAYMSVKERLNVLYDKCLTSIDLGKDMLSLNKTNGLLLGKKKKKRSLSNINANKSLEVLDEVQPWYTIGENILGYKIECKGMFMRKGSKRTRLYRIVRGKISISGLNEDLEYITKRVVLKTGTCSVKVWLYKKNEFTFLESKESKV